jgi:hypothetical protein
MRSLVIVLAFAVAVGAATHAAGQPAPKPDDKTAAREAYAKGKRHYDLAEYDEAIAAWKQAYHLQRAPLLLFNIAQAFRLKGDCASARQFYASYRREEPAPKNRAELEAAEALCAKAAIPPVVEPKPVVVEPKPVVVEPKPVEPKPVEPTTTVPAPTTTTRVTVDRGRGKRIAGLTTGGAGIALIGAGLLFQMRASNAQGDIEAASGEWTPALAALEERGRRDRALAIVGFGAGVAAVAAGTALYLLGRGDRAVEIAPTAGGAAVSWHTRF